MKKIISIILCAVLLAAVFAGCSAGQKTQQKDDGKLKIVCTIFPEYDWTMNILGDKAANADVTMLLDTGADLHSYQPTADDMIKISDCDLFIYVGGESDKWVDDALKNVSNKDMKTVNLLETVGKNAKEEEVVEGMQSEEEEEEGEEGEEGPEYDEHVWLSLRNAQLIVSEIAANLGEADAQNKDTYTANAASYKEELSKLDSEYVTAVSTAKRKVLLFGDRFPFRYMADDYNIKYYAAFVGCSAETEASFETVTFLAGKVDELGLKNVMVIEKSDQKIAKTIIENTKAKNQKILVLDSMQNITADDVKGGASYLEIMQSNLDVLKTALS